MKLAEANRTQSPATTSWSPLPQQPAYLAAGTVAGTMGLDFDTSAHLEIMHIDFSNPKEQKVLGKTTAADRFHKLVWGLTGVNNESFPLGIIAGGLANGSVNLWDPSKIISQDGEESLIATCGKHASGVPIQGLDFNPFQHNLLASGGGDSEIYIWDLQNAQNPNVYTPGAKTNTQDSPIASVAWNKKVQHILGSVNHNGVVTVWNLKVKRAVLNFSDPNRKIRCRTMAWDPEEGTQLITASEDDSMPIIEIWDLRNTYSPAKVLEGHTGGIWSVSWCPMDNDLLLSTGKDNKTLCWNVRTGQILCEVDPTSGSWNFDVQWSPRLPAIFSTCSFEGKIKLFSLQDLRREESSLVPSQTENFTHAPKWMKRPIGATFGFGGKLYSFKKPKPNESQKLKIRQVITEQDILTRADKLEEALNSESLKQYCDQKISESSDENEKNTWNLLKVLFDENQRQQILAYLGYNPDSVASEIAQLLPKKADTEVSSKEEEKKEDVVTEDGSQENKTEKDDLSIFGDSQEEVTQAVLTPDIKKVIQSIQFIAEEGEEGIITKALLVGNFEVAVDCCIEYNRMADALILAAYGGPELWKKTQEAYFKQESKPFMRLVSSIVKDELRDLVEQTDLSQWKAILAILCTYAKREEFAILCSYLGDRLSSENKDTKSATICYICAGNVDKTVHLWANGNEKNNLSELQGFIEKVTVLRRAIGLKQPPPESIGGKYVEYSEILASQGRIISALHNISFVNEMKLDETTRPYFVLLDRLYHSEKGISANPPPFPYKLEEPGVPVQMSQPATKGTQPGFNRSAPKPVSQPYPTMNQPYPGFPATGTNRSPISNVPLPTPGQPPIGPPPTRLPTGQPPIGVPTGQPLNPPPMVKPIGQPPIGQPPIGQPPIGQPPIGQPPIGQPPIGQPPIGQPPIGVPTGQPLNPPPMVKPIGQPPIGQPPIGQPPIGQPPIGQLPLTGPPVTPVQSTPQTPPIQPISPQETKPSEKKVESPKPAQQERPTSTENQAIIDQLNGFINTANKNPDQKIQKLAKDVQQRFKPLFDKLASNEFSPSAVQSLSQLCQAITSGDSRTAQSIHQSLTTNNWEELGSALMIGIKRLIEITKQ